MALALGNFVSLFANFYHSFTKLSKVEQDKRRTSFHCIIDMTFFYIYNEYDRNEIMKISINVIQGKLTQPYIYD